MENRKLYTIGQMSLAAFVGSPAAGFILAARDLRVLGDGRLATRSLFIGCTLTLILILCPFFVHEKPLEVGVGLSLVSFIFTRWLIRQWLEVKIDTHIDSGGLLHSGWRAFGIGLGCTMVIYATLFILALAKHVWRSHTA